MKKRMKHILFLILFLLIGKTNTAQDLTLTLTVFEPLPEISLTAFISNDFLEGQPRIMQIIMAPHGVMVIVKGRVEWQKVGSGSYQELSSFTTEPFLSRNFYNDDLASSGIGLADSEFNDDLLEENRAAGKPTGAYRITLQAYDANMQFLDDAQSVIPFTNPAQTLTVMTPFSGSYHDVGGVTATWSQIQGAVDFYIKANVRTNRNQTLENALSEGNPALIDDKQVGVVTSVQLRDLLDREWLPGQEIVFQVRGVVPYPGGQNIIYSEIINFFINQSDFSSKGNAANQLSLALQNAADEIKNLPPPDDPQQRKELNDAYERVMGLLNKIQNGELSFENIRIVGSDGNYLTYPEFIQLLQYLNQHPEALRNISFEE